MKKFILLFVLILVSISFSENIITRGVNGQIEYMSAIGNGSDTLPYTPLVSSVSVSKALDLDFIQAQGSPTTLGTVTAVGDTTIHLTDTTGFIDGNVIGLFDGMGNFYFGTQVGAPIDTTIKLDMPLDRIFPVIGSVVIRALKDMNVNGSLGAPQIFQIGPIGSDIEVDITRISGYIQTATAIDLAKFGDIAGGLTNGIVFRKSNGNNENFWNAKTNGRLKLITGVDLSITDRAPGGSEGLNFRLTYAGPSKHGVTLRLQANETLEILIQDDLSTLEAFEMMAQGHVVTE